MIYDKFAIRLWLKKYAEMGGEFNLLVTKPENHLYYGEKHPTDGYRDFVVVKRDASTGVLCITVDSRNLDCVDSLVIDIVERVTVDIEISHEGQKIDGVPVGIYTLGGCSGQRSTSGLNRHLFAEGKDPFVLRDFVQDILDRKIQRSEDGEKESLTVNDLQAKLDDAERTIEQIKFALEHAETEKAEAMEAIIAKKDEEILQLQVNLHATAADNKRLMAEREKCREASLDITIFCVKQKKFSANPFMWRYSTIGFLKKVGDKIP